MGLFEYLHDQQAVEWQTKDFKVPSMRRYRITDKGHLEKGRPLDLPHKYAVTSADFADAADKINKILKDGPRFAWTKHGFSGAIDGITSGQDGQLREARFEFEGGVLIWADEPTRI